MSEPSEEGKVVTEIDERRRMILKSIVEGRKMDAYAEHRTKEMHTCWFCQKVCYQTPVKKIGERYVCIECLKQLKEIMETLDQWEKEIALAGEVKGKLDQSLTI